MEIDELCLLILARRQPMASDLRFITFVLKMVTDLERIGDLAVNICERALDLCANPASATSLSPTYRDHGRRQCRSHDPGHHGRVRRSRRRQGAAPSLPGTTRSTDLYVQVFRDLLEAHAHVIRTRVERGIHEQSIAKWLERIGDHATNLAEQVIFMVKGKDVRHPGKLRVRTEPSPPVRGRRGGRCCEGSVSPRGSCRTRGRQSAQQSPMSDAQRRRRSSWPVPCSEPQPLMKQPQSKAQLKSSSPGSQVPSPQNEPH